MKLLLSLFLMRLFRLFPIKNNKVLFTSFYGKQYSDSPKAISEMLSKDNGINIIWLLKEGVVVPNNVKVVKTGSLRSYYEIATSKVWIDNCRKLGWIKKRNEQFYLQTWHGGVALKVIEKDAGDKLSDEYIKKAKNDSCMADAFISECEWQTNNYRNAFWYDGDIIKSGLPRSDVFFDESKDIKSKVFNYFGFNYEDNLVLYAPTFRVDEDTSWYLFDYYQLLEELHDRFGGNWRLIIRLHSNIMQKQGFIKYNESVVNGTEYPDMNELIVASDILITDYSSSQFDAYRIHKPVFLYMFDLDEYIKNNRSLYFDVGELPGIFSRDFEDLKINIHRFNKNEYESKVDLFNRNIGYYHKGGSTERVVDLIKDVIECE